jgi:2-isopropylmalate synthase
MNIQTDIIHIYDTTLRDGTQREGISLSSVDKLRIARRLDELGVPFIEGGWPGSNPKDADFFEQARKIPWKNAKITAFGATCRARGKPEDDANIQALVSANTQICTIFGKSWDLHVLDVLGTSLEDNLRIIEQSVAYLKTQDRRVMYDGEHFFDGYKKNPVYALETLRAAIRGGAEIVVLCDTNGGTMPWEVADIVRAVNNTLLFPLGIHTHNDSECAVANTLTAVREGAVQVQGTINGYGERCGNADLCAIIPDLELKMNLHCLPEGNLSRLFEFAHFVDEIANQNPDEHRAYVGKSAFAHKAGVHASAMRRNCLSYQHVPPESVGNQMRVLVSELSGRGNIFTKAEEFGLQDLSAESVGDVLNNIKTLESQGFAFEAAEASAIMLLKRQEAGYIPPFELIDFLVNVEHRQGRGIFAEATVKVRVDGEVLHTAAEGNGPVNALDQALRKALTTHYPALAKFHLADYKVRILDGENGTRATTRVLIDTQNGTRRWSTMGASANIIEASWRALADAVEYGLLMGQSNGNGGGY